MEGIVLSGVGGFYTVLDAGGNRHILRAQGKIRRQKTAPMAGDRVTFQPGEGSQHGWLNAILPRKNALIRPPVANIDALCVVVAAVSPEPDLALVDRMLMFARQNGMDALLAVNKCDTDIEAAKRISAQYSKCGAKVYCVSAMTGEGLGELAEALRGTVHAFSGQSGVGKSTLINRLYGLNREVGALSERIERGKNTTRHCELIPLPDGGMTLDTPGFSLLDLTLCDPLKLGEWMPEFAPYEGQCRFSPCAHVSEPGCAVRDAVQRGDIPHERWRRYCDAFEAMRIRWRDRYD